MITRRQAWRSGQRGETLAVWWLRLKGYAILSRGYAIGRGTGAGEIDIVARRGKTIAFVEVKVRPTLAAAAQAITPAQQRRIVRAAAAFLAAHPRLVGCDARFDAVLLAPGCWPRHISDAWRMDA
ncbi:YraN family protein [Magnetospirillum sulfuroxidans]|uniref:UPF0102 protein KEC16_13155 n=1 Tax=Magnetospirillum sulfuroxidans TaxID=611300 RepID=A0ABS5IE22_9PROT|nr:YraN family protein [Magnetospirillum sulfuroxidans]